MLRRKIIASLKIIALLLAGFSAGTVFGLREGGAASFLIDSVPKGVLSMSQLKAIDNGNLEPAKLFLNSDINQGLYYYSLAQEKWWFPLFKNGLMFGSFDRNTEYVSKLANFRKLNPGPAEDPAMFDTVPKGKDEYAGEYAEMAASHRDRLKRITSTISRYSSEQSNPSVKRDAP